MIPLKYICLKCNSAFTSKKATKNRTPKYCSRKCSGSKTFIKRKVINCLFCDKVHTVKDLRTPGLFCSSSCSMKYTGKNNKNKKKDYCKEKNHA